MAVRSVVVLNDFCHVQGGASRVAIDEAVALKSAGLDVTFLGAVGPIAPDLSAAGVRTICLQQPQLLDANRHPKTLLQALWNRHAYRATQSLLETLDRRQTIVHLHGYTKALTTTPALAASRAGFAVICTLHDFFAACPNGAFFDYRRQRPCPLRALSAACMLTNCDKRHPAHKAYRTARGLAQRHVARFPASVRDYIALSEQSVRLLRPYLPADARFHGLSNIIHVACDPPVDAGANRQLVVVGRLDAEKGVMLAAVPLNAQGCRSSSSATDRCAPTSRRPARGSPAGWRQTQSATRWNRHAAWCFPAFGTRPSALSSMRPRRAACRPSSVTFRRRRSASSMARPAGYFRSDDVGALERCLRLTRDTDAVRAAGAAAYRRYWSNPSDPQHHTQRLAAIYERHSRTIGRTEHWRIAGPPSLSSFPRPR